MWPKLLPFENHRTNDIRKLAEISAEERPVRKVQLHQAPRFGSKYEVNKAYEIKMFIIFISFGRSPQQHNGRKDIKNIRYRRNCSVPWRSL